ncbi:MAG: hypothetical protein E6772_02135 [Dysgonomonas sp.]|nr:hypothetical protein [Dysgonomonas sp.]
MVDSKELRRGNYIKCTVHLPIGYNKSKTFYTRITEIRDNYVETDSGIHKYSEVSPIDLTEKILLNSGGKKVTDNEIIFGDSSVDSHVPIISIVMDSDNFYLDNDSGEKYSVPIESVHHFQNIYFDLTGREVTVFL